MKYRAFPALAALLTVGVLVGCGDSDNPSGGGASSGADREPLRVALNPPAGGALGVFGKGAVQGWELAAAEVNANGGIDGRKVQLKVINTDGTPPATVRVPRGRPPRRTTSITSAQSSPRRSMPRFRSSSWR